MDKTVIDSYPRYESYKDSSVDWLGDIPEGWRTEKGKWLFNKMDRPIRENDGIVTCFRDGEVTLRSNRRTDGFTNALKEHGYQGIRKGDLVIHQMDAFAGAIGVSDSEGKSTPVYSVCVPKEPDQISSHYYMYFMRSMALRGFILSLAKGIRERSTDFRYNDFAKLDLPLPPYNTQVKITEFIEHKTTQIDQAITLKQQQISKLEEYKQIVIQNAVTKGLNPNAPMKDSGVDWIGEIPEHWEVKKLKRVAVVNPRVRLNNLEYDESVSFLPMEKVSVNGDIDCSLKRPLNEVKQGFTVFEKDDVILAKITPCFENGKGALLDKLDTPVGFGSTEFHVIRAKKDINQKYLYNVTQSPIFLKVGEKMMIGSAGQKRVPTDFVSNYEVALPSLEEQHDINKFIDNTSIKIRESIEVQRKQIDRLKEYKTILINQAVTGKIKIS
ncbi:restriction endonuclease subunit S [Psychrobacter sp.]|uniref:restriction endonuclease subunit S n=1 Tax=Psychrobacter sp. TaxID=56811 RepID=UPI003F9C21AA